MNRDLNTTTIPNGDVYLRAAGAALLPDDDRATLTLAQPLIEALHAAYGDSETLKACVRADGYGHLSIEVDGPLVADDRWCTGVRFRWSRTDALEVLVDDAFENSCPSPEEQAELAEFVQSVARSMVADLHRARGRYCTGSLDQHDVLRHYAEDGDCPIHPDAEFTT